MWSRRWADADTAAKKKSPPQNINSLSGGFYQWHIIDGRAVAKETKRVDCSNSIMSCPRPFWERQMTSVEAKTRRRRTSRKPHSVTSPTNSLGDSTKSLSIYYLWWLGGQTTGSLLCQLTATCHKQNSCPCHTVWLGWSVIIPGVMITFAINVNSICWSWSLAHSLDSGMTWEIQGLQERYSKELLNHPLASNWSHRSTARDRESSIWRLSG